MSPSTCTLHVAVLAFLFAKGYGGSVVIIPETTSVIEHAPLRLDCFYQDYGALPDTTTCRWSIVENGTTSGIAFFENCKKLFEKNYIFECTNQTANSMIIKSTDRNMHGTVFSCSYFVDGTTATGYSTIRVIVPVSSVNLTQPETNVVITTENKKLTFSCNASAAHPKPDITWYSDSQTPVDYSDDVEITNNITLLYDYDGYLYTVVSYLTFYPTKFNNGLRIYCNASNIERQSISSTRKALLNVQFPPGTPIIKILLSEEYVEAPDLVNVVENTNIWLECAAESKPPSNFTWSHPVNENKIEFSNQLFVNRIPRNRSGTYTCNATNEMIRSFGNVEIGKNSSSIYVGVLYPPDTPTFYYLDLGSKHKINTLPLKVVEGDSVSLLCNATGNPAPTSVWVDSVAETDILSIVSVEITHQTNATCKSFNMMNDTFGRSLNGTSSNNFSIIVLHPPRNPVVHIQLSDSTMEALNHTCILEGSDFRLYCNAVSNPSPSYKWTGPVTSNTMSNSEELFISNIQRNQSGPYICYTQNEMERSFGNTETGRNNQSIYFDILYKATIKYFGASDFENNQNMLTINQREDKRILCIVESNPFSNSTIFFKGRLVNESVRSDTVTYNLVSSKCSDAGRYICKGKNEYNYEEDASKELFLYVKCLPQPSVDQPPEKNVSAALTGSALFRFHASPYYDPGITEFRWFKQENDSKSLLRNGTKTYISSSNIHSVLRIIDVSEADFGMYMLQYNNSVGINNFTFYLQQRDQIVSEEIYKGGDKNYIPVVIGIVTAVLVIVGITLGIVIYIKRYKQKTDKSNSDGSYDDVCGMNTKSGGTNSMNREPVYEGLKPIDERGYLEMKEQAYDILKAKDSVDTKDPVYTNLKL